MGLTEMPHSKSSQRILLTGATGLAGPWLHQALSAKWDVITTSRHGGDIPHDLTDPSAVDALIEEARPTIVVNTVALTDVDECERDRCLADRLNQLAVTNLVNALPRETVLVHFSTDQVYPDGPGPHRESGAAPVNVYGQTKLAGEVAALSHPNSLVLRTNFFGPSRTPGRSSFSDFVITHLNEQEPMTLFTDLQFSPVHLETLGVTLCDLVDIQARNVVNLGSRQGFTKSQFGIETARHLNLSTAQVTHAPSTLDRSRAPRPGDTRLDLTRVESLLGRSMPTLREEIARL